MNAWLIRRARALGDPESMVAATIMAVWTGALVSTSPSLVMVVLLFAFSLTVHSYAVESASHGGLWFATGALVIIVVSTLTFITYDVAPVWFAVGGASALAYQQLVSLNTIRRRQASFDGRLIESNLVAVGACCGIGLLCAAVASQVNGDAQASWLWVPAAVFTVLALAIAIAVTPIRWASSASKGRYRPGERIARPPQSADDLDS